MKLTTDWSIIPTYKIDVGNIVVPYDISRYMKRHKIDKYLYQIIYKGIVIKYGMSADKARDYGERVYRQIGHIRSWGQDRLTGSSGSDWRIIEEDFNNLYGMDIDRMFVKIKIWDVSKYPFQTITPRNEIFIMESELIETYVRVVGEKPIGNINDDANRFGIPKSIKPLILTDTWTGMFEL